MDIKPTGVIGGWSNIVHFTDKHNRNYGHHGSRIPAIWMYSNSARMHVRNGRPQNVNDGCDPVEQLKLHKWSSVKVTQAKGKMKVFINGALVCENSDYGKSDPARTGVLVYGGDPWHNAAKVQVRNLRYDKGVSPGDLAAKLPYFTLKRGKVIDTVDTFKHYSLTFKVKPLQKKGGWSNVFHFNKSGRDHGAHGSRIPGIWFFSGTTRMHVRQGRPGNMILGTMLRMLV
jgi:hypothetical protein